MASPQEDAALLRALLLLQQQQEEEERRAPPAILGPPPVPPVPPQPRSSSGGVADLASLLRASGGRAPGSGPSSSFLGNLPASEQFFGETNAAGFGAGDPGANFGAAGDQTPGFLQNTFGASEGVGGGALSSSAMLAPILLATYLAQKHVVQPNKDKLPFPVPLLDLVGGII